MKAILVSVDYGDLLNVTLPYNRHHFAEVMVVTTPDDDETYRIARRNNCRVFRTDSFYADGASFNKWRALEEGLDAFGREGLMCIMDADILWPKVLPLSHYRKDCLYTPKRFIWPNLSVLYPPEAQWKHLQLYVDPQWAGYTQIFWADDPHLPSPPWHEQDWRHAGGADSAFQNLWPPYRKVRPDWKVLHLGSPGQNWTGRATPRIDGKVHPRAGERRAELVRLMGLRRTNRDYSAERLPIGLPDPERTYRAVMARSDQLKHAESGLGQVESGREGGP